MTDEQNVMDKVRPIELRFEHFELGMLGQGKPDPRISWSFTGCAQNWTQARYELRVEWDDGSVYSEQVASAENTLVAWPSIRLLQSHERAAVSVRVQGQADSSFSSWSDAAVVEAGLLHKSDWKCSLIEGGPRTADAPRRPITFATSFIAGAGISNARLYITAQGVYEAQLNGKVVGDHVLAPGWTSYSHRLIYHTFDILPLMNGNDTHSLEVTVAEGWYCGRLGFLGGRRNIYGESLGLLAMVVLEYHNGKTESIGTDEKWEWFDSPILASGIYDGERLDNRLANAPRQPVTVTCQPVPDTLCAPDGPPVRRIEELRPREIFTSPSGARIVDFGQNFVGRVRACVCGPRGHKITFRHAEVLEDGEIGTRPLRQAAACDSIILSGEDNFEWEAKFTFHGFRYVAIHGWFGTLSVNDITGIVIHTDMRRLGQFACSNPLLNKLHGNVIWSMRGNFLSIPTDCPQRDERLGWTGDINVFADTANFLFDTRGMLVSWLKDLSAEQSDSRGIVPLTIPNVVPSLAEDAHAIWGDVAIMLPWSLYTSSGDKEILAQQFESMRAWLSSIPRHANGLWNYTADWKLGDWLDPLAPPDDPGNATTDPNLISDAFLVHVTRLMAKIVQELNAKTDVDYDSQAKLLGKAFAHEYIAPSGRITGDTQTAYALALHFKLLITEEQQNRAAERLEELIRRGSRFKIATGFAGTPYLGHALTEVNLNNLFYRMLLHRKCPSWLYPVTMGATTIWERWDSMLPSGQINPGEMTSFNHYALGSVVSWMHRVILGLSAATPGWHKIHVEPVPGGGLSWAKGSHMTQHGLCEIFWRVLRLDTADLQFWMRLQVPLNAVAHVKLPGRGFEETRGSGTHIWTVPYAHPEWPPTPLYPPFAEKNDVLDEAEDLPSPSLIDEYVHEDISKDHTN